MKFLLFKVRKRENTSMLSLVIEQDGEHICFFPSEVVIGIHSSSPLLLLLSLSSLLHLPCLHLSSLFSGCPIETLLFSKLVPGNSVSYSGDILMFCVVLYLLSSICGGFQGPCQVLALFCLGLYKVLLITSGVCSYSSLWSSQDSAWLQGDVRVGELWGRLDVDELYLWVKQAWGSGPGGGSLEELIKFKVALPFNESQVYELCQPNTCRLWKA